MNLEKLKETNEEVTKELENVGYDYDSRKLIYERYIKELELFLKNNPGHVWATTQKIMVENFEGSKDVYPEDLLYEFLKEHHETLSLEDKALIVNNMAYYEFENNIFKKETILRLERIAKKGIRTKSILYPLVFTYVKNGSSKILLYIDDLKSIMGNTLELLLWEALGYRFLGKIDKSCELLEEMIVNIRNEISKDNGKENMYLLMYSELARYNLCYNKYMQKDFDYVHKELSSLEKEIDDDLTVELMYDAIFNLYYLMDFHKEVKRIGEKMIGSYVNKGFFERYLYAIYKSDGMEAAKSKMEDYLKETTKSMSTEIKDDLTLNENVFECTETLLEEMLFITTSYNKIINNDIKPKVYKDDMVFYSWIQDCFLENCIMHTN